jgi:transketolase
MEEVGVTEAGEAAVEVGAVGEDEAAHEAVEVLSSLRACLTTSTTTVCTTREIGTAFRHDTTETGDA